MRARDAGESLSKAVVIMIGIAMFNAFRRGDASTWFKAKAINASAPSTGSIFDGGAPGGLAAIGTDAAGALETAGAVDLVTVGNTKMSPRFAERWRPLTAAALKDGIVLTGGAYRSPTAQISTRKNNCGPTHYDIYDKPASQCHPPTARPGHSRHETGDAIDVTLTGAGGRNSPEFKWLSRNAARFGVHNLPSEPWHWSIDGH